MATENSRAIDEAEIRQLMDDRAKAVRAKDLDGLMANYAADVVSYDVINSLQNVGSGMSRKRAEEWFAAYQGPIGYELRDLRIAAGDDVAFCHSLNRISGTMTEGGHVDMWVRTTVCYRKIDGRWLITHEHTSVPFDVASGKAVLDLQPAEAMTATSANQAAGG